MGWPAETQVLFPDKSCMICVEPIGGESEWWTTFAALLDRSKVLPTNILAHYFTINHDALFQSIPFIAEFEATNDQVIVAYKVINRKTYLFGVSFDALKDFKPPKIF